MSIIMPVIITNNIGRWIKHETKTVIKIIEAINITLSILIYYYIL